MQKQWKASFHTIIMHNLYMLVLIMGHTSVFKDKPLLKKMVDTAMYFTVISGFNGPAAHQYTQ